MAKGELFLVTLSPDDYIHFDESNYYDRLDSLGADYVRNLSPEESAPALLSFEASISRLGARITGGYSTDDAFAFEFEKGALHAAKINYFGPKLEALKRQVHALSVEDVADHAPALDWMLNNDATDMVAFYADGMESEMTVDDFIRHIEPDTLYYVYDRAILMH